MNSWKPERRIEIDPFDADAFDPGCNDASRAFPLPARTAASDCYERSSVVDRPLPALLTVGFPRAPFWAAGPNSWVTSFSSVRM